MLLIGIALNGYVSSVHANFQNLLRTTMSLTLSTMNTVSIRRSRGSTFRKATHT